MRTLLFMLLSGCVLVCSSCKQTSGPGDPEVIDASKAFTVKNMAYGSDEQQKMDVYLPANRNTHTRILLLIHGGGWTSGSKEEMNPFIDTEIMAALNMGMVNIGYRLATENDFKHPAQMEDIKQALDFLQSKAESWIMNPDSFALAGASAGGHLSLLYDYGYDQGNRVHAVINLVGPTNFITPEMLTDTARYITVWGYLGKTHWEDMALWQDASPYWHAGPHCAATYQFMGDADAIVPYSQGLQLRGRLDSLGIQNHWQLYAGAGHGWWPGTPYFTDTKAKLKQFLLENLY